MSPEELCIRVRGLVQLACVELDELGRPVALPLLASSAASGFVPGIAPLVCRDTAGIPRSLRPSPAAVWPAAPIGAASAVSATILSTFRASWAASRDS